MGSQSYILTLYSEGLENNGWIKLHDEIWEDDKAAYIGSQLERCPSTGRVHWQAFVHFKREAKQRGSYFKKFDQRIHFEVCSKLRGAAINYGTKEETRVEGPRETGTKPPPAKLKEAIDWDAIKHSVLCDRKEEVPFSLVVRHHLEQRWDSLRGFYMVDDRGSLPTFLPNPWGRLWPSKRLAKRRHYWIWSARPNLGKTTMFAKPLCAKFRAKCIVGDSPYMDVDTSTECVIFDEYNSHVFKYGTLNAMCDGTWSYRRFYKKPIVLNDPLIIILSNQNLVDIYPIRNDLLLERFNVYELI